MHKLKLLKIILFISFIFSLMQSSVIWANAEGIQVYHKNLHLSAMHKRKLADDISRYRNADNIWDVLRDEFSLPHYENSQMVQEKIDWFMNNQDYLLRSATRAAPYLYYILQQVKKRHLPAELVLLPIIESGYNPFSFSNVGAAGIWQIMPGTATGLGIRRDSWYDGRLDIIASTRGALNHLAYLQNFFEGNWLLAIAAYNTGEGNVLAAIKRNIRAGRRTDFWSLPVHPQTRDYVPSLLALATIISRPDIYPLYFPPVRNAPYLAQIDVGKQINLQYAAKLAGLQLKKLLQLNPGFSHNSTARGPYHLILPIENIEQFSENLSRSPFNQQLKWYHYQVKKGDTLIKIATKFNSSVDAIKKLNQLSNDPLKPGMNVLIPNHNDLVNQILLAKTNIKSHPEPTKRRLQIGKLPKQLVHYSVQPGDTVYMIRSKDTLESIAKRFKMNSQILLAVNQLKRHDIKPGKELIIPAQPQVSNVSSQDSKFINDKTYVVKRGDTLASIATKFNTSQAAIRIANLIDEKSLPIGEKIVVPMTIHS